MWCVSSTWPYLHQSPQLQKRLQLEEEERGFPEWLLRITVLDQSWPPNSLSVIYLGKAYDPVLTKWILWWFEIERKRDPEEDFPFWKKERTNNNKALFVPSPSVLPGMLVCTDLNLDPWQSSWDYEVGRAGRWEDPQWHSFTAEPTLELTIVE